MEQKEILNEIENLKGAVLNNDVSGLLDSISIFGIDTTRLSSPLISYASDLMIETISNYVTKKGKLKVNRKGEYGSGTFDIYLMKDGKLQRNGSDAIYTSIGKLYLAYKKINKK